MIYDSIPYIPTQNLALVLPNKKRQTAHSHSQTRTNRSTLKDDNHGCQHLAAVTNSRKNINEYET